MNRHQKHHQRRQLKRISLGRSLCFVCVSYCCYTFPSSVESFTFTCNPRPPSLSKLPTKSSSVGKSTININYRRSTGNAIILKAIPMNHRGHGSASNHNSNKRGRKQTALEATKSKLKRTTPNRPTNNKASTTTTTTTKSSSSQSSKTNNKSLLSHNVRAKRLSSINHSSAGAWYQRDEMMQHEILTKENETILGRKIARAKQLRNEMIRLLEKKRLEGNIEDERHVMEMEEVEEDYNEWKQMVNGVFDYDGIGIDLNDEEEGNDKVNDIDFYDFTRNTLEVDQQFMMFENDTNGYTTIELNNNRNNNNFKDDQRIASTLVQDGSKLMKSSIDADLILLSEHDVKTILKIKGGKNELRNILHDGAKARNTLMRSNIRLVVSVGKKWMSGNKDTGGMSDKYNGSWNRPSLDEVIQEGMLGLARAVDKFDPDRGLRFSTYSTHWITSYVRQCFQVAATGCLKVPSQLHDIKSSYKSIVKRSIDSSEAIPSEEEIAAEIGVTLSRLRTAIRVTESLLSIDEPVYMGSNAVFKGSGAGGDSSGENTLLISDRLECSEIAPVDYVENGFLRQSLENAMAAELSPYERDILRLRLGLDDGQTRTVKQVVEECGGGISIAEVRSAERRAFRKLRSPNAVHAHNLVAYLEMADIDIGSFDPK